MATFKSEGRFHEHEKINFLPGELNSKTPKWQFGRGRFPSYPIDYYRENLTLNQISQPIRHSNHYRIPGIGDKQTYDGINQKSSNCIHACTTHPQRLLPF